MSTEVIEFQGIRFRRYPESKRWADRVYFSPGVADRKRGVGRLHEEVWKAANGPIPDGHHIHHIDFDTLNNEPTNLDCLTDEDHHAVHAARASARARMPDHLAHLDRVRPQAAAWHRSVEGKAWHSEHGRRTWEGREPTTFRCDHCGDAFESRDSASKVRFCSNACKTKARAASGVDDERRTCAGCGQAFTVNRYARTRFCSRACANRSRAKAGT